MSYEKTTWKDNDVITKEKLNNIENGIANASGYISWTMDDEEDVTLSVSYNDIVAMFGNGVRPFMLVDNENKDGYEVNYVGAYKNSVGSYQVDFYSATDGPFNYYATSADAMLSTNGR